MAPEAGAGSLAALGPLAVLASDPANSAVVTDFDGTLAPIVPDPETAVPIGGATAVLARLARVFGVVGVVSGRPVPYLRHRLADAGPALRLVGVYGLQWWEDGEVRFVAGAEEWTAKAAQVLAGARAEAPPGVGVEDKTVSVTVHWRMAPDAGDWAHRFADHWGKATGLVVHRSRMAIDFRPPLPIDKGSALRSLVAGCRAACFAGDDTGDLAAFATLDELAAAGMATVRIAVADAESPPGLIGAADMVVEGPGDAVALLERLADAAER